MKARHTSPILDRGIILVCNIFGFRFYSLVNSPGLSPSKILILQGHYHPGTSLVCKLWEESLDLLWLTVI